MRRLFLSVFVALCFVRAPAQQELPEALTEQSLTIRQKLQDLRMNSVIVTEQLITLSEDLKVSQQEAQEWKDRSTSLSASLRHINNQLNDSYETIIKYEQELERVKKSLTILVAIFLVLTSVKLIAYILYFKGIKLPRWLDILV